MKEERVVSLLTFNATSTDFASVREKLTTMLQRRPIVPGLIEASLLTDEHKTRLVVVSTWHSRDHWAAAQWDDEVQRIIADAFQETSSYDLEFFSLLSRVEGNQA